MDHERPAVWSKCFDYRIAFFIIIGLEPLESASRNRFEIAAGGIQYRALVFLAIALDGFCKNDGGQFQFDIVFDIRLNFAGKPIGRFGNAGCK